MKIGGNVTLECSYNLSDTVEGKAGVNKWYKESTNGPEVSDKSFEISNRVTKTDPKTFTEEKKADLKIQGVSPDDQGLYLCEVEFTSKRKGLGNGTQLFVDPDVPEMKENFLQIVATLSFVMLLLIVVIASLLIICKGRARREGTLATPTPAPAPAAAMEEMGYMEYTTLKNLKEGRNTLCPRDKQQDVIYANVRHKT